MITTLGAAFSAGLALLLIPRAGLAGAAAALLLSSVIIAFVGNDIARRLTGFTNVWPMLGGLAVVAASAALAYCVNGADLSRASSLVVRCSLAAMLVTGHLFVLRRYLHPANELFSAP